MTNKELKDYSDRLFKRLFDNGLDVDYPILGYYTSKDFITYNDLVSIWLRDADDKNVYVYVGKPYSNIDSDDKFICSDYVKEALTEKAFYQRCFEEYLREIEDFDCLSVIKNMYDFFEIDNSRYQTLNEDYVFIGEYGEYISHDESLNENYIFIDEHGEYISRDEFVEELDRKHILKHFDEV